MREIVSILILSLAACSSAIDACRAVCDEKAAGAGAWIDCRNACDDWAAGVSTPTPVNTFWAAQVTKDNTPVAGFWTKVPMDKKHQNEIQHCLEMAAMPEETKQ